MRENRAPQSVLQIHLSSLQEGKSQKIQHIVDASSLDFDDEDVLVFHRKVSVNAEAYLADNWLIIQLDIQTKAKIACGFCNEMCSIACNVPLSSFEVDLDEIEDQVFDYSSFVRESILLEVPFYPLCGIDVCARREEIEPYLLKRSKKEKTHRPFEGIDKLFDKGD